MSYNFDCEFQSDEAATLRKQIINDVLSNDEPPDYDATLIMVQAAAASHASATYIHESSYQWCKWFGNHIQHLYYTRTQMDKTEYGTSHDHGNTKYVPERISAPNITTELYKMVMLQKKQIERQQKQMDELREMIEILPCEEVPTADLLGITEQPNKPLGMSTEDWDKI